MLLAFLVVSCEKKKIILEEKDFKFFLIYNEEGLFLKDSCITANENSNFKIFNLKTNSKEKYFLLYTGLNAGSLGNLFYILKECPKNKFCKVTESQGILDSIEIESKKSIIYYHKNSNSIERNYIMYFENNDWKTDKQIGVNNIPIEILHKVFKNKNIKEIESLVYNIKDSVIYYKKEQIHYLKNPNYIDSIIGVYKGNSLNGYNKFN
ncbi:MAG: hypothetical protein JST62_11005 [Bacteroidetes bacterium]|nr:hypothetical protein [Bacteroidota bacterium]